MHFAVETFVFYTRDFLSALLTILGLINLMVITRGFIFRVHSNFQECEALMCVRVSSKNIASGKITSR